jgi:uroporphyrinogen-III synthase
VSIGPVTSEEARSLGLEVVAEAETHGLDGLVAAVKLAASHASSSPS